MALLDDDGELDVLTVAEVSKKLRINLILTYRLCRQGIIPSVRLGDRILVPVPAYKKWLSDPASLTALRPGKVTPSAGATSTTTPTDGETM